MQARIQMRIGVMQINVYIKDLIRFFLLPLLIMLLTLYGARTVLASQEVQSEAETQNLAIENIEKIRDKLPNVEEVESIIGSKQPQLSFKNLMIRAIKGTLDLSPSAIIKNGAELFAQELLYNADLIRNLFIICLLSALLKNLTDSFKNKSVGELGFYCSYIIIVTILLSSFQVATGIVFEINNYCINLMEALLPMVMSLVVLSGNVSGASIFNPLMIFMFSFIALTVKIIFAPAIVMTSVISIINYLTEKPLLTNLVNLCKTIIKRGLQGITVLFLSVLTLQKISAPLLNNLVLKTAKSTAKFIPVVGDIVTGALESAIHWGQAAKSGVFVAIIISLVVVSIVPLVKLLVILFTYKLVAALIQPICDDRIVKCIDSVGGFCSLLFGCGITMVVMFIFSFIILISV